LYITAEICLKALTKMYYTRYLPP